MLSSYYRSTILLITAQSFLFASLFLFSCSNARKESMQRIDELRDELYAGGPAIPDPARADELVRACLDFATRFPQDSLAPAMIYEAADLMMNMGNPGGAFEQFERLRRDYPQHEKSEDALFLMAFITENEQGDLGKARNLYEQFLNEYPSSDFADDAEACIRNLGKSAEELIREFQARQEATGDTTVESGHSSL